ncbi:hypothetical protein [Virgibacillus halodenitrificans]|uniref:hypothetical protein n=1 Tax=Virgibacillus halodenitrificans TaxID=1482 RepID=UPI000EF451D1|nr:hypothetical protein [Virgibacillus halodenitrificans]
MNNLIKSIRKTTKLYCQPSRIGDVIEYNGEHWLVIGIQDVQIKYSRLEIVYVCQNLELDFTYQPSSPSKDKLVHFELSIKTGKEHILKDITLGRLVRDKNNRPYQTIEYTDIEIKHTDIVVSFLARPINPVSRKEAKERLLNERKKKLDLTLL